MKRVTKPQPQPKGPQPRHRWPTTKRTAGRVAAGKGLMRNV